MENYPVPENRWLYFFGSLGLLLVIAGTNLPYWAKFFVFVLFSYVLGRLSAVYKKKYGEEVIRNGILGAMGVFTIMFVVGALVPVLGYRVGLGLFFALLSLLIARIVSLFSEKGNQYKKWLSGAGIGIFGLYVAYDTNNILKRADYYQGDFITASMDYYLDIINLVQNVMHVNN
jgi:FtsH-binding integral membrane protein